MRLLLLLLLWLTVPVHAGGDGRATFTPCSRGLANYAGAHVANALTVDELVARNIRTRGGLDKIKAIHSLKMTGKFRYGSTELEATRLYKRQLRYRSEATMQGLTAIQAFDGTRGWRLDPFGGRRDKELVSADESRDLAYEADFEGPLVDYQAKGHRVEYLGTEDVDGTEAHKLRVSLRGGDTAYVYLDPDYFLEIRVVRQRIVRGVEVVEETDYSNYERVGGVYFPFSIETGGRNGPKNTRLILEKGEANVPIDEAVFRP
ncbi:MAG: hypothetical protein AB1758_04160 [Candidatus Eremiobacterota bacterium]